MKNIKLFLFPFLLTAFAFLFCGTTETHASQTTINLQPGRVYEFTSNDPRTISYVTVSGNNRYEYVSVDQHGSVIEFGMTGGRCPVRGGGFTRISVSAATSAGYDASRISVTDKEGLALTRLTIPKGNTITLRSQNTDRISVTIDNTDRALLAQYDCVIRDDEDKVSYFAMDIRFTSQNIPTLGSATFTAGDGGLTLLFPNDGSIRTSPETRKALIAHPLTAGQSRNLTNDGSLAVEAAVSAQTSFVYDFVLRDAKGYTTDQENNHRNNKLSIPAGHSLTFTPKNASTLFFPADWQNQLRFIQGGDTATGLQELEPGQSLIISNTSPDTAHDIRIASKHAIREFTFDYLIEDGLETRYAKERRDAVLSLPPGADMTITAGEEDTIEIRLPSHAAVSAKASVTQAVAGYMLEPGASALITNTSETAFTITPQSDATTGIIDFVRKDHEGEMDDFGRMDLHQAITIETGHTWLVTNRSQSPAELTYPYKWFSEGLTITPSENAALKHLLVNENKTIHVSNSSRQYAYQVKTEGENTPAAFDYVLTNNRSAVTEYGIDTGSELHIPAGGRLAIMPQRNTVLSLFYPAEWDNHSLKISDSSTAPLFRATYKPNARFRLQNRTRDRNAVVYEVQNNSLTTTAAYFTRENTDSTRIAPNEQPERGFINVPEDSIIVITVATGSDLEIWVPQEWAKQLVR